MKAFLGLLVVVLLVAAGVQTHRLSQAQAQLEVFSTTSRQLQEASAATAACQAKFSRSTYLYDGALKSTRDRHWIIPADIDPIYTASRGAPAYSHYDPQTQTESALAEPKRQEEQPKKQESKAKPKPKPRHK